MIALPMNEDKRDDPEKSNNVKVPKQTKTVTNNNNIFPQPPSPQKVKPAADFNYNDVMQSKFSKSN